MKALSALCDKQGSKMEKLAFLDFRNYISKGEKIYCFYCCNIINYFLNSYMNWSDIELS